MNPYFRKTTTFLQRFWKNLESLQNSSSGITDAQLSHFRFLLENEQRAKAHPIVTVKNTATNALKIIRTLAEVKFDEYHTDLGR